MIIKCKECQNEFNDSYELQCPSCRNEQTTDEELNILDWIDKVF
jgi:ribosomal protein S27E